MGMQDKMHKGLLHSFFSGRINELPGNFEQRLFKLITLPNGTTKNTYTGRLKTLDSFVMPNLPKSAHIEIKDIAASSGISTLEWAKQLEENRIAVSITATDLYIDAFLVMNPSWSMLCDQQLNPLLVEKANSLFRTSFPTGSMRHGLGKILSKAIKAIWINEKTRKESESKEQSNSVLRVELLSPAVKNSKTISFIEEDILLPPSKNEIEKYNVIRAANILNNVYFDEQRLKNIVSNLFLQLKPGGLLIVCKTDDAGINHASLFTKKEKQFSLLEDMNGGSEIKNTVLGFSS